MLETFYQNIQSSESWALGFQINKSSVMMTLIRALSHHGLQSLIRFNLLSCQVLQNFKSLETGDVQQNFWSSGFFGTWFFRIDVLSCRLLSCHNLQNFKPLETGDVHSELLVFRLLWRLVLLSHSALAHPVTTPPPLAGELLSHSALAHPVTTPPPLANEVLPWCSGMSSRMSHPPLPVPSYPVTKINR